MSKIKEAFIPFITCGDPSLELTMEIVKTMEQAGADLIELGIPFSKSKSASIAGRSYHGQNIRDGKGTSENRPNSNGIYDLRQCGIFLWNRAFFTEGKGVRHGWNYFTGCTV